MPERLISTTLAGGLACLLLLIFKRLLTRRSEPLYYACLAALILFAVPFRPIWAPDFSKKADSHQVAATVQPTAEEEIAHGETSPHAETKTDAFPITGQILPLSHIPQKILTALWLAGVTAVFLRYLISYLIFRRKILKDSVTVERRGHVRIAESNVPAPMLVGFFRPVTVMPKTELSPEERELAICHELAHWRRGDPWVKLLAVAVNSIHWFNPLSYILVRVLDEACEYACDNLVVLGVGDRTGYGNMLLTMACKSTPVLTENISRNKKQLKRRIELIMKLGKKSVFANVLSIILILTLAAGSTALAAGTAPVLNSLFGFGGGAVTDEQRTVGILDEYLSGDYDDDTVVTRAEGAALMIQLMDMEPDSTYSDDIFSDVPADHWAAGSIRAAYIAGIINGCGDGTFHPDDPLTLEQTEKMILCVLGYNPTARAFGGWPAGYLTVASQHSLSASLSESSDEAVTRRTLAKMIYNALDIPFLEQVTFGATQEYAPSPQRTLRNLLMEN